MKQTTAKFAIQTDAEYVQAMRLLPGTPCGSMKRKVLEEATFSYRLNRKGQGNLPDCRSSADFAVQDAIRAELLSSNDYSF